MRKRHASQYANFGSLRFTFCSFVLSYDSDEVGAFVEVERIDHVGAAVRPADGVVEGDAQDACRLVHLEIHTVQVHTRNVLSSFIFRSIYCYYFHYSKILFLIYWKKKPPASCGCSQRAGGIMGFVQRLAITSKVRALLSGLPALASAVWQCGSGG